MSGAQAGHLNPSYKHGHTPKIGKRSREYSIWAGMKTRCTNPRQRAWARYGGRGITVCARWSESFEAFLADMGACPSPAHSLDRIDGNRGYEPGNCRWATCKEQSLNSTSVKLVMVRGVAMCLGDAAKALGVDRTLLTYRIKKGMTAQEAVDAPTNMRRVESIRAGWAKRKAGGI